MLQFFISFKVASFGGGDIITNNTSNRVLFLLPSLPLSLPEPSYAKGSAETSIFLHIPPDPPTEGGKATLRHSLVLPLLFKLKGV